MTQACAPPREAVGARIQRRAWRHEMHRAGGSGVQQELSSRVRRRNRSAAVGGRGRASIAAAGAEDGNDDFGGQPTPTDTLR